MSGSNPFLVCFALSEEARPLRRRLGRSSKVGLRVTGMGRANAVAGLRAAWGEARPGLVITAGFAGGLDPVWRRGAVLFAGAPGFPLGAALLAAGARPATFHCADRMAVTAAEKRQLYEATGADAVEMESGAIQEVCASAGVPCATVRVISDPAEEDLPLDLNRFSRRDGSLNLARLLWAVARAPRLAGPLLELRRHSRAAAMELAEVLVRAMQGPRG